MDYPFEDKHECTAVVIHCIDFRFWKQAIDFVEEELKIKDFDFATMPGAAKCINESENQDDLALQSVEVPIELHQADTVVIINHEDCGAYGGSDKFSDAKEEEEFHQQELKKAAEKIQAYYPEAEVITAYAKLSANYDNIEYIIVE